MIQQVTIKLLLSDGTIKAIVLHYSSMSPWFIESPFDSAKKYEGDDLFQCLQDLRIDLAKQGAKLLCNGARIDAYPSRMARDMSGAKQVYVLHKGKQANLSDLVDIFGDAPADCVSTVAEQENFYQDWIGSLR